MPTRTASIQTMIVLKKSDIARILWWRGDTAMLVLNNGQGASFNTRRAADSRWLEGVQRSLEAKERKASNAQ